MRNLGSISLYMAAKLLKHLIYDLITEPVIATGSFF